MLLPQAGEYVTFRQAVDEGHPVKKGEKASMVFFFTFLDSKDEDTDEPKKIFLLKYYSVFYSSQCEGMKPRFASPVRRNDLQLDERAESMISDYVKRSGVTMKRIHMTKPFTVRCRIRLSCRR